MVFVIATSPWRNQSAVPSHFRALGEELARRGHQVTILLDSLAQDFAAPHGNPAVLVWPSRRPTKLKDALFLRRLLAQQKPDCLIANFASVNLMTLLGWLSGVRARVVWYHTIYEAIKIDNKQAAWKRKLLTLRKRWVYNFATQLVPVSRAAQKDLCAVYGVPPTKCQVFYNPLDDPLTATPATQTATNGTRQIVCVGRFDQVKGQDVLIRAARLLKPDFPHLKINFVGGGVLQESCQKLAQTLGVEELCVFRGNQPHDEVLNAIKAAELSVVPSRIDNCPLTVIESLACGKPLVASKVGGIPELLEHGAEGFLVPPNDPSALAEQIRHFLGNESLLMRAAQNARARFLKDYALAAAVAREADWFEQLNEKSG
jgi:glycosyltransferase involved in cell wall biosynthesis